MTERNFASDEHNIKSGILLGLLFKAGLAVENVLDKNGDYTDKHKIHDPVFGDFVIQLLPPTKDLQVLERESIMAFAGDIDGVWLIQQIAESIKNVQNHTFPRLEVDEDDDGDPALRCPWCRSVVRSDGLDAHVHDMVGSVGTDEYDPEDDLLDDKEFMINEGLVRENSDYEFVYHTHRSCHNPVSLPEGWDTSWA